MHVAYVDITLAGTRYLFGGPARHDHDEALRDLQYIRSCAEDSATQAEGLQCMKLAAKGFREEKGRG